MSYDVLKSENIYNGRVFHIEKDDITLPDGRTCARETVVHGGAAAMIPIDENGKIIFVRQYRHSARTETLELPAGTLEKGEDPLVCATRELEEETSYKSNDFTFLFKMYSAIGFCSEILYIYLAENLIPGKFNMDDDEFITIERYTLEESIAKIWNGEICDSKTIAGILAYKEYLTNKN